MLDIVSDLTTETFKTLIPSLVRHQSGKLFEEFLKLLVLLEILKLLKLSLVYDVSLEVLETLGDALLHHCLVTGLRHRKLSLVSTLVVAGGQLLGIVASLSDTCTTRSESRSWATFDCDSLLVDIVLEHVQLVVLLELLDENVSLPVSSQTRHLIFQMFLVDIDRLVLLHRIDEVATVSWLNMLLSCHRIVGLVTVSVSVVFILQQLRFLRSDQIVLL